jgi:predicted MFS family arabinose efflux permease
MLAMVLFGLGEVLGCFFIGYFIDKFGSKFAVIINILIVLMMAGITFAFIIIFEFNAFAWIMCFLWGFQDSAVNTHTQEILGFEFDDNYTPFSLFNIWQSLACFGFQIIDSYVNDQWAYMYYTILCTALALIGCGITYWFPFREEKAQHTNVKSIVE